MKLHNLPAWLSAIAAIIAAVAGFLGNKDNIFKWLRENCSLLQWLWKHLVFVGLLLFLVALIFLTKKLILHLPETWAVVVIGVPHFTLGVALGVFLNKVCKLVNRRKFRRKFSEAGPYSVTKTKVVLGIKWHYRTNNEGEVELEEHGKCVNCGKPVIIEDSIQGWFYICPSCKRQEFFSKYLNKNDYTFQGLPALIEFVKAKIAGKNINPRTKRIIHNHPYGGPSFYS
jgi:hypothetical protein